MKIGYFLSCEEYAPEQLLDQASMAESAGFDALWISDHFHPWNDQQGQSPLVWSVIGALSERTTLPVTTAVTCPTIRTHPVVIAQAAATSSVMLDGGFTLGVGTGEALNEHVTGARWPVYSVRAEMLDEAVSVIRKLWSGDFVDHHGPHYTVENARIYTRPQTPPPIYVSGLAERGAALAGRVGDGFICTKPNAALVKTFREHGGEGKVTQGGYKVCWSQNEQTAVRTAHRLWANSGVPGELAQVLPSPKHFEQAASLVTEEMTRQSTACGNDVNRHVESFRSYVEAGYDEVFISQMGGAQPETSAEGFFEFYASTVLPRMRDVADQTRP
jgi:G6PDH family F420-dependent oxidoreductase